MVRGSRFIRMKTKTFFMKTYGCKMSQYDSEQIREFLVSGGMIESDLQSADIVIVNGCSVTANSERKIRQFLRSSNRTHQPEMLILTGCYAKSLTLQNASIDTVEVHLIEKNDLKRWTELLSLDTSLHFSPVIHGLKDRTRAFVKIQDGCNQFCSYCIIPYLRGRVKSRDESEIFEELDQIEQNEIKEIVLTGIHIGQYGQERKNGDSLAGLVKHILDRYDFPRVRLSSIEPTEVTDELIELFTSYPQLCPFFHISLQSASDRVLSMMNRPYQIAFFKELCGKLCTRIPNVGISTDIIVGFPGETEEDFACSMKVVEEIPFVRVHIFPYSDRPFAKSSSMPGKIPGNIIKERARALHTAAHDSIRRFYESQIGHKHSMLVETINDELAHGYSENYLSLSLTASEGVKENQIIEVTGKELLQVNGDWKLVVEG